jgi:hypothetical protein
LLHSLLQLLHLCLDLLQLLLSKRQLTGPLLQLQDLQT